MTENIDWEALKDLHMMTSWTPEQRAVDTDPFIQPKWDIPKKVCIQCAISGGGARLHNANPNQPRDLDTIRESAAEAIEAGPPTVTHFDHDFPRALHTRDGKEMERGDSYMYVIKPLLEKYGREKVLPHINTMQGTFRQQMLPYVTGLAELTYNHAFWAPDYIKMVMPLQKKYKIRGELVIHQNSEIEGCNRVFIKSGLMPNPNLWIMLPGAAPRNAFPFTTMFEYYPNQKVMAQRFVLAIQDIKEIDPDAFITVCCSGRASTYLVTLAMIMGCHVRVGMEDTVWQYPHSDEMIKSNADTVRWAFDLARMLGREPLTPNEYRESVLGVEARFDHAETLRPME
jgi:3-keto-5-aminohexanoate cleavage enzyme